jgi:RNA recognition motif-containing protein
MNIEVSNLHLNVIESDLKKIFAPYGEVNSVELLRDKVSNRSRGRAFIEMPDEKEALQAIKSLDGTELMAKTIVISQVKYDPAQSNSIVYKKYPTSFINLGRRSSENSL